MRKSRKHSEEEGSKEKVEQSEIKKKSRQEYCEVRRRAKRATEKAAELYKKLVRMVKMICADFFCYEMFI